MTRIWLKKFLCFIDTKHSCWSITNDVENNIIAGERALTGRGHRWPKVIVHPSIIVLVLVAATGRVILVLVAAILSVAGTPLSMDNRQYHAYQQNGEPIEKTRISMSGIILTVIQ